MDMKYVAQEEPGGCLVAAIAMVTGLSYWRIRQMVEPSYQDGIHGVIANDVLAELGYAVMTRYRHRPHLKRDREIWPCPPFAPAHIVHLHATRGPHAVAMDAFGRVFDPWKVEREGLAHPDYQAIDYIEGVFRVEP